MAVPALIVYGTADPFLSAKDARALRDSAAVGTLAAAVPGAGHLAHLDQREAFLGELLPFLQAADAANAALLQGKGR